MGVYILANHKRAVVLYCLCHMQAGQKYFNNSKKCRKFTIFFRVLCEHQRVFAENYRPPPRISVLKIKRYRTGLTQGYNWYGGSGNGFLFIPILLIVLIKITGTYGSNNSSTLFLLLKDFFHFRRLPNKIIIT